MEARSASSIRGWEALEQPSAAQLWAQVAPSLAAVIRADSRPLSEQMLERIRAEMPDLVADPDEAETNRASNEANLLLIADMLEAGADPAEARLPVPTRAYAEFGAGRNTPMTGLLRAYRIGHAVAWEGILAALPDSLEDPADLAEAVGLISGWLHRYIDAVVCQGEEAYVEERERWLRSSSAVRTEVIKSILDGVAVDPVAASARLGYELGRDHVALIAWVEDTDASDDPLAAAEEAIRGVADGTGAGRPLIHPVGIGAAAGWVGLPPHAEGLLPADAGRGAPPGVRIAIGRSGAGVDGFRRSYQEAGEARRVAGLGAEAGAPAVTRYDEVSLQALGSVDLAQARELVTRELGPLLGDGSTGKLIETLAAYLDAGGSFGRAAGALGVHENTVRYRVRQIEDALGRVIGPGDLQLRMAVELVGVTGLAGEPGDSARVE